MPSTTRDLMTELVGAFGNPDDVAALLATNAQWWITPTVGVMGSPSVGKEAIAAGMRVVFGQLYTDVHTDVHHIVTEGPLGAARFTMRANIAGGRAYSNEYCVFVETRRGAITRVWEYLDVAHATAQFTA